ncbi:unnamed protein product [Effrenium voratum]|uniref:BART domain-containing protein n=1 Tax=Effrenium voratum TaxID=2562239 RepID=A0AA36N707_9DINO|nr:unnamed protein product [Effrenium voratum]
MAIDDEHLVELVERLTDDNFLGFVDQFVEENCGVFVGFSGEHLHCFHTLHSQYQRLFESRAEAWLRERGFSPEALARAAGGLGKDIADSLLAVGDYQAFVAMMLRRLGDSEVAEPEGWMPATSVMLGKRGMGSVQEQGPDPISEIDGETDDRTAGGQSLADLPRDAWLEMSGIAMGVVKPSCKPEGLPADKLPRPPEYLMSTQNSFSTWELPVPGGVCVPPNRMMHERLRAELENLLAHVDLSPTRRKETSDPDTEAEKLELMKETMRQKSREQKANGH